ncbi:hypothetical protein QBC34DRAFT_404678 [Podospora aff. communis PSN243]|uniref:C2H2-type domain-containing protein n=1 Tax=Podospora aff. communis PSN243 TaxID=3040156 RepID=A0AAV9GNW0_9PEZI|nr:hypothetical protein QBC34DRAFT_404678 [Podospora aff. communis PSN243]
MEIWSQNDTSDGGHDDGSTAKESLLLGAKGKVHLTEDVSPKLQKSMKRRGSVEETSDPCPTSTAKKQRHTPAKRERWLACPFWKYDTQRFGICFHIQIDTISRLKQHLVRRHTAGPCCPRCEEEFNTEIELHVHLIEGTCNHSLRGRIAGLTPNKRLQLVKRSPPRLTRAEQWFRVFDILFPGVPRPESPYLDDPPPPEVLSFAEFSSTRGPSIIQKILVDRESGVSRDVHGNNFAQAITQAMDTIFDTWQKEKFHEIRVEESAVESSNDTVSGWSGTTVESSNVTVSGWSGTTVAPTSAAPPPSDTVDGGEMELETPWSLEDDAFIVQAWGNGSHPDQISEYLPGRSPASCHRRYPELHASWCEDMRRKAETVPHSAADDDSPKTSQGLVDHSPLACKASDETVKESERCIGLDREYSDDTGHVTVGARGSTSQLVNPNPIRTEATHDSSPATPSSEFSGTPSFSMDDCDSQTTNHDGMPSPSWLDALAPGDTSQDSLVESIAVDAIVAAYFAWLQASMAPTNDITGVSTLPADDSAPPSGNTATDSKGSRSLSSGTSSVTGLTSQSTSRRGGTTRKRRKQNDDDDEGDDLGGPPPPKRKQVEPGERLLACPWQKRHRLRHSLCGKNNTIRGFDTIAHVKEHIRHYHVRYSAYCPRCKEEFGSAGARDAHVLKSMDAAPCTKRKFKDETMLSWDDKLNAFFKKQVSRTLDIDDQWFCLWDKFFSGVERPATSRVDDDMCEHLLKARHFISSKGDDIVKEVIRDHNLIPDEEDNAGTLTERQKRVQVFEVFAVRTFNLAIEKILNIQADAQCHAQTINCHKPSLAGRSTSDSVDGLSGVQALAPTSGSTPKTPQAAATTDTQQGIGPKSFGAQNLAPESAPQVDALEGGFQNFDLVLDPDYPWHDIFPVSD